MCGGKTVAAQMSPCIAWTQNTLQKYSFRLPPKLYFLKCILLHRYADADDDCDADADADADDNAHDNAELMLMLILSR